MSTRRIELCIEIRKQSGVENEWMFATKNVKERGKYIGIKSANKDETSPNRRRDSLTYIAAFEALILITLLVVSPLSPPVIIRGYLPKVLLNQLPRLGHGCSENGV